jgi:hypothetical protein
MHVESIRLCMYCTMVGMEGIIILTAKIARNWRKHDYEYFLDFETIPILEFPKKNKVLIKV